METKNVSHKITVVIPAYNEESRIEGVICKSKKYANEVIVVNDFSKDNTADVAKNAGAQVISNKKNLGYIESIKKGFKEANGDIIVTLDADGEHNPADIPRVIAPILEDKADLVLGKRCEIARLSERFLNFMVNFKINVSDTGTGFRAIRKSIAVKLKLRGKCICGIYDLEALKHGARIKEVPITINTINKPRKIAWFHLWPAFYVLREMIKSW